MGKKPAPQQVTANQRAEGEAAQATAVAEVRSASIVKLDEKIGIQNVVEIIAFGSAVAKALKEAKANDGKIDFKDIGLLFPVAPLVVPMIDGITQVPKELGDLDAGEIEILLAEVSKALGSENNAKLVLQIKAGLKFAHAGYEFYRTF